MARRECAAVKASSAGLLMAGQAPTDSTDKLARGASCVRPSLVRL
jgi:hypothetical protein